MHNILRIFAGLSLIAMMLLSIFNTFGVMGLIGYLTTSLILIFDKITGRNKAKRESAMTDGTWWRDIK
jgi:hypothetical protein